MRSWWGSLGSAVAAGITVSMLLVSAPLPTWLAVGVVSLMGMVVSRRQEHLVSFAASSALTLAAIAAGWLPS